MKRKCTNCKNLWAKNTMICPLCEHETEAFSSSPCSAVGGEFYNGLEWFACWLLDNKEGETITEELLRPWAYEAWQAHLEKQNASSDAAAGRHP